MNKTNICNNCGKGGHVFHQCKLPITSYGIILFRSSTAGIQYLMIRRKDSFGYIDLIRGKYSSYNVEQIQKSVDEMSIGEKARLKTEPFENLWKMLWGENNGIQYRGEEIVSSKKFEVIKLEYEDLIKEIDAEINFWSQRKAITLEEQNKIINEYFDISNKIE